MAVEVHDDHLPLDAPDEEWLALVGRKGRVAVTKDRNVRYRAAEVGAIKRHSARVIVIRMKSATGPEIAELPVKGRRRIARFALRGASLAAPPTDAAASANFTYIFCVSIGYTMPMMKDSGLRIRVQRDLREKFLEVCRAQDKTAAQVIREFMRSYINWHEVHDNRPREDKPRLRQGLPHEH